MDDLRDLISQAFSEEPREISDEELTMRRRIVHRLFKSKSNTDSEAMRLYLEETIEIPVDKLAVAVILMIRSHRWPSVPSVADVWSAAREVSGMNREQYHAGRYLPAQREWPAIGERHGVVLGEREKLGRSPAQALLGGVGPEKQLTEGDP
jgi:hypothetical protein